MDEKSTLSRQEAGLFSIRASPLTRAILACVFAHFAKLNGQVKRRDMIMDAERLYRRYQELQSYLNWSEDTL